MGIQLLPAPGVAIARLVGDVTVDDVAAITAAVEQQAHAEGRPIPYILVIPASSPTPPEAVRNQATIATRRLLMGPASRFDIVIESEGVIASMQRVIMRGLIMTLPERRRVALHARLEEALLAICDGDVDRAEQLGRTAMARAA